MKGRGSDLLGRVRWWIDRLQLSVQSWPFLSRILRLSRRAMVGVVRSVIPPSSWRKRELQEARRVFSQSLAVQGNSSRVLLMSFRAWTTHTAIEMVLARALQMRGANVQVFFCGGGLPICEIGWPSRSNQRPCRFCGHFQSEMIAIAGLPQMSLSDVVSKQEQDELITKITEAEDPVEKAAELVGLDLSPLVEQSYIWFFRSTSPGPNPEVEQGYREFIAGGAVMATAADRLLGRLKPDVVVMVNGLFFEERIVREKALARGIRVVTYESAAQRGTLFFTEGEEAAPAYDISELWESGEDVPLTEEQETELDLVFEGRSRGVQTERSYYTTPRTAIERREGRKLLVMFTNVSWDTAVTGRWAIYDSMFDWVQATIEEVSAREDVDLVIRVHPAETRVPGRETREKVTDFIEATFPMTPDNVTVIPPEQAVDSYALIDCADAILVFASTVGLEAAALGKPVCVAADRHYRGKGFTFDPEDAEDYRSMLKDLSWASSDNARMDRARRYAFLFFCRALVSFDLVRERRPSEPVLDFEVKELGHGAYAGLDAICDLILATSF